MALGKFTFLLFASFTVLADEFPSAEEFAKEVANNVSHEYVVCAAYYAIVASALENSGKQETAVDYKEVYENTITLAVTSATIGRDAEMAMDVTTSRLLMEMDAMEASIDNDYANISLLMGKYLKRCEFVLNSTEEFIQVWESRIRAKYSN